MRVRLTFIFSFLALFLISSCHDGNFHGNQNALHGGAVSEDAKKSEGKQGEKKEKNGKKKKKKHINEDFIPEYDADSVSMGWGAGEDFVVDYDADTACFYGDYGSQASQTPAAFMQHKFDVIDDRDTVKITLTFSPNFVDNSYGDNAIGWGVSNKGHSFKDLVGSDHAIINITSDAGDSMTLKLDYISETGDGTWGTLGPLSGKKKDPIVNTSHVAKTMTSLDRNLNERGYGSYTTNSPKTDSTYTPNPDAPNWDFRVVYEVWIYSDFFKSTEGLKPSIKEVHASPSKTGNNTLIVEEKACPPEIFN